MAQEARPTDVAIQEAVLGELRWDSRVNATDVGVTVRHGTVTLAGSVETLTERLAAQDAAHRVAGVLDVANDIEVKPAASRRMGDTEIAEAVRRTLEWSASMPSTRIRSTVSHGVVSLEGDVEFLSQREDAEAAVRHIAGVRSISNDIKVTPPVMTPADVRAAIANALERRALRYAHHVGIDVDSGVVTLTGPVRSWGERRAVIGTVSTLRGVAGVVDRLTIDRAS